MKVKLDEIDDDDELFEAVLSMTEAEVDEELRRLGYNPNEIRQRVEKVKAELIQEVDEDLDFFARWARMEQEHRANLEGHRNRGWS
jgi:Holliday junction resolvasome RuvABC DNA-binding subunit